MANVQTFSHPDNLANDIINVVCQVLVIIIMIILLLGVLYIEMTLLVHPLDAQPI